MQYNQTYRSPNYSSRNGRAIVMVVIHATVGSAESSLLWLCTPASRVSSHFVISKRGTIYQLVDDEHAAWHAGASAWRGLDSTAIQEGSLGIELENANDGKDPYPHMQVEALSALVREKMERYAIAPAMLVRHLDIAIPAGRKTDPAGFDWTFWKASVTPPSPTADPLRAHLIAGPPNTRAYFCGEGFYRAYSDWGGLPRFGYALSDEARDGGDTWMRWERAVAKYSQAHGVELALLSEAKARGWV